MIFIYDSTFPKFVISSIFFTCSIRFLYLFCSFWSFSFTSIHSDWNLKWTRDLFSLFLFFCPFKKRTVSSDQSFILRQFLRLLFVPQTLIRSHIFLFTNDLLQNSPFFESVFSSLAVSGYDKDKSFHHIARSFITKKKRGKLWTNTKSSDLSLPTMRTEL